MENKTKKFTYVQSFPSEIVAITKLGGYMRKDIDGKKLWYPERLMVATRGEIYEWEPVEMTVPVGLPIYHKTPKKKSKRIK